MRYSKMILAMLLMFVMIFGSSMMAFGDEHIVPGKVTLLADPLLGGEPVFALLNGEMLESPITSWVFEPEDTFTIDPNANPNFTFVEYYVYCKLHDNDRVVTDEDYVFDIEGCEFEITARYAEDPHVMVTIQYEDTSGNEIKDETEHKVYFGSHPIEIATISGWDFAFAYPHSMFTVDEDEENVMVTVNEESEDFTIVLAYFEKPPVVTETVVVTDTVYVTETVYVNVPTTVPTTEAVTEEEVPLGSGEGMIDLDSIYDETTVPSTPGMPIDLDSIYDQTPAPTTTAEEEDIVLDEVPLADALPQTGQLPAESFYGIGGLISSLGLYLKKRSMK